MVQISHSIVLSLIAFVVSADWLLGKEVVEAVLNPSLW